MKKSKDTFKLSNESLVTTFAGLEEALMADTLALKAMDEDIKTLNLMLKKLSFEMTGVTFLDVVTGAYKLGYDFDKKVIVFQENGKPDVKALTLATVAIRKDAHASMLDELLVHLKRKFEAKAKPSTEKPVATGYTTTVNTTAPVQKPGLFGGTRQA